MKTILTAIAGLALSATAAFADPILGTWKTEVDDGSYAYVGLKPCNGGKICGTIDRTFNAQGEYNSPNKGEVLVRNMVPQGNGRYEGRVWRPSNNKVYLGKMNLNGNTLQLQGCVAGGLLCSSQTWARVN
ncbi:Uncharacterized conserved protein, DUF2147 family [Roseivivax halotolerans]|jgi:uncharacterized protein (DUF2147 family)|uniref:Uncharacterized conserved protein, DUF2147 family n=1 Tax=Roseivivax halotolerans TaxID=93684 RepID=A0A1I5W7I3_9RHOB|nr:MULTISPECIES: DUF2147 domain-containing protein [Roseivivax]QFT64069.1 hypothetical protein FIU91_14115 [Roseivivax sp. THAF30]SFQ15724.1 Uncharacterized conserved protein, DUF2147 family [Roseivivax halotolerans]